MGKKLALNVAYTVGLFLAAITAYWGFEKQKYVFAVGGIAIAIVFLILKAKLLKELKSGQNK